ncbi:hypothetical protein [Ileibacterium valens]|uniref:hypothetical protein n=1 Tax=Ileibacterium valens TaxID=1862668 RepID=UPI002730BB03|nr:hypothetical protein [Ileibacterium valens]
MTDSYISMGIYGCLAYLEIDRDSNSASYYEAPYTPWGVDPQAKKISRKKLRQMVNALESMGYTVNKRTGKNEQSS